MKKMIAMMTATVLLTGCFSPVGDEQDVEELTEDVAGEIGKAKKFTFTVKGDFGDATFRDGGTGEEETRGYMSADGAEMTDLWVFDYMGDSCCQRLHQIATDEDWGSPRMSLSYGDHHVYFVASRGSEPEVDTVWCTVTWGTPRDTYWKDYPVSVVSTSNGNRAVTLDRVVTKLKLTVNDEIPSACASLTVLPATWNYGINYRNGRPVSPLVKERIVTVPASYAGTSGVVNVSVFGLSGADEWTTDVDFTAKDADGGVLGTVTIPGVPFRRNRSTEYSGSLFGSAGLTDVGLSGDWETARTGTW